MAIAKACAAEDLSLERVYTIEEIAQYFSFCKRDLRDSLNEFFSTCGEGYAFNTETLEFLRKAINSHREALPVLEEAEITFVKAFGRFPDVLHQEHRLDYKALRKTYGSLHDVLTVLHWGRLPILNRYLMINSGRIPEDDLIDFYDQYDMLNAMLKDIQGKGEVMSKKADETLDRAMSFCVHTRRWGHRDTYTMSRTLDGWEVKHIAINGACEKDGTGALFINLNHDCVFYPEDGVKYALSKLWEEADEGELTFDELQTKLQQIADWISTVEKAVGDGQPDWVGYY